MTTHTDPRRKMSPGLLNALDEREPLLWLNPGYPGSDEKVSPPLDPGDGAACFQRCVGLLADVFPELAPTGGRLCSPLVRLGTLQSVLSLSLDSGSWFLKRDDALPVAGSVKARGGFHEVLSLAERIALERGLIGPDTDRRVLAEPLARACFEGYTLAVGSTGNLGLAIGLIGAGLGFSATVHMSSDAKAWKKQRLRDRGIAVVEHTGDYAAAVAAGRTAAHADPRAHFVDDERSPSLFLGYAAAAAELQAQLAQEGRPVDAEHPLFVYLPCGVGGAPGGILYGLKRLFGVHVHGFFVEPAAAPCMLVQLACGLDESVSVYDIGLDNRTEADGLAVGLASPLVAPLMAGRLSGVFTVDDPTLFRDAWLLETTEGIYVEPSAAAGLRGPNWLTCSSEGAEYLDRHGLDREMMRRATHVIWSTGGSLVPEPIREGFRARGRQ